MPVGYRDLIMPRVIPKTEEVNTVSRNPYIRWKGRRGRPWLRQWHIAGGGHIVEGELQRGG